MRVAFDTSVLVAASIANHPHAPRAQAWLDGARAGTIEGCASSHAFAELYATLTAMPVTPRIAPGSALRVVRRLADVIRPTELAWDDYGKAIDRCVDRDVRSGGLYDGLHLIAAERDGADILLTFNTADFVRLARVPGPRILAPPDPPAILP